MPKFLSKTGSWTLAPTPEELPNLAGVEVVFADVETISGDPKRPASMPYHGDRCVGVAFTIDKHEGGWYIPMRHADKGTELFSPNIGNMPHEQAVKFLNDLLKGHDWVNHNIKFDAHFLAHEGVNVHGARSMIDTLTLAKLIDGQRRMQGGRGYGLKPLMEDWFGVAPDEQDEVKAELKRLKTKDYGDVDAEIMGEYAVSDVTNNRKLWHHIVANRYEGDDVVWDLEIELTSVLFDMEQRGLPVDLDRLIIEKESSETEINRVEELILEMDLGVEPGSKASLQKFLLDDKGLPVVSRTDKGAPSIDKMAIGMYLEMPDVEADAELHSFLTALQIYREHSQFVNLYCNGWQKYLTTDLLLHANFNQLVATGRMSCLSPNLQQLNERAKQLIVPRPGMGFISRDYSQVEYRIIVSVCREMAAIAAYNDDAATDFHQFVAELCGVERRPAKTINFGIAFGMGEKTLVKNLTKMIGGANAAKEAARIFALYHRKFPRIKLTSKRAANIVKGRAGWVSGEYGYIKTLYGRRRDLRYIDWNDQKSGRHGKGVYDGSHKAFNTTVQGTAADIAKAQLVKVARNPKLIGAGIEPLCIVHDEILSQGSLEATQDPAIAAEYERTMNDIDINLGVPLAVDGGWSDKTWAEA